MRKLYTIFAAVLITSGVLIPQLTNAQAPQKMSYQAVIRNSSNTLITSQAVGIRISILKGTSTGSPVYVETQTPTTNINGLASMEIGSGTVVSGNFSTINWANGPYFIKTETDPAGGTNYSITGTSELMSVPYALFSGNGTNGTSNYWTLSGSDISTNTAGNVGIGTATPLSKLSVQTGTGNYGIIHSDGVITLGTYIGNGKGWLGTKSNHPLTFFTNNSNEQMTLLANGNFGIGTTAPSAKLHIAGNVKIDGNNTLEFGAGVAGKEVSAGKIGYQSFGTFDALDIVGAGTGANRKIRFWNEGGAEFRGSVAVGVTDPLYIYKMDIADRIRIRSGSVSSTAGIALNNSNNSTVSAFIGTNDVDMVGIYGSVSGWGLLMNTNTGAVGIGYQFPVAGYRLSVLGNQYIDGLMKTSGDVEIGGDAIVNGKMNVNGGDLYTYTHNSYAMDQTGTGVIFNGSGFNVSINAAQSILASSFICISDARMKNILGVSNSAKDLEIINALQITDYTMKDKLMYGDKPFKKVIAQEVEKVYPQVVSKHKDYIPNVYQLTSKVEKTANGYLLTFTDKHNISSTAKKLRVIEPEGMQEMEIVSIPSVKQVIIKGTDIKDEKVFVYGEQVDDFRTVDYEGLTTLNISATQELSKLVNKQQLIIDNLQKQIDRMELRLSNLQASK